MSTGGDLSERELVERIEHHQRAYYSGTTEISDAEFDLLWDELVRRNPEHPLLRRIGSDSEEGASKIAHIMYMHSQSKARTGEELQQWAGKLEGEERAGYIAEYKLDGVSIELQYERGRFARAATRGDGSVGDDVTENIRLIAGVPQRIEGVFSGGVRGEIILPIAKHAHHYPQFANCRNTAAGIVKRKDRVGCEHLQIICYDALHREGDGYFRDNDALLCWLGAEGFCVVEWRRTTTVDDVIAWHGRVMEMRATLPYEIDGVVVKTNAIITDDRLRAKPKYQIAFKFAAEERTTILREVVWSQAGHLYTPIGITDAVQLAGTTVQRANLANMHLIDQMGLHIGAEVAISKRGEIIPKIERLVRAAANPVAIRPPVRCINCDVPLVREERRLYCPNIQCPKRIMRQLRRWIEVLEIKDFGEVLIRDLYRNNIVQSIADLYRLKNEDIAHLERQGEKSAEVALHNLHRVREVALAKFIAALNIENVGEKTIKKLIAGGFSSIDALVAMRPEEILHIEGIGEIMAPHICANIAENRATIAHILDASGITLTAEAPGESALAGKVFCFTGALSTMGRKEAARAVEERGGEVRSAVSAAVSYVVTNTPESQSAKMRQAQALGVAIINEEEFVRLLHAG